MYIASIELPPISCMLSCHGFCYSQMTVCQGQKSHVSKKYVARTLLSWSRIACRTRIVYIFKNLPRVYVSCPFQHCRVRAT